MKKRFLSLFLALYMLMTFLPMTAMATDGGEEVNADAIFEMQDFNLLSENKGNGYNVGWKYAEDFQTDTITALEVGLKDPNGELIVKYTASGDQLTYQRQNGYINDSKQSSAPFIKNYNEIEDEDWSVVWGEDDIHAKWNVSSAYVTVTTAEGSYTLENTECKHTHSYTEEVASDLTYKGLEENGEKAYYKTCPDCGAVSYSEDDTFTTPAVETSGYILSAAAANTVLERTDCENYTMYVKFTKAFADGTNLWFVIEGPEATYGIAGSASQTQCWSFLNQSQFESWPEGVEPGAPAAGAYEVRIYETEELVTADNIPDEADLGDPIATETITVSATPAIAESGYILNGAAANETTGRSDCADYTMYVKFGEAFPEDIQSIWFVITDPNGKTYGIAGNADYTTHCWSFLNQSQFESWPTDVEPGAPAEGKYTITAYASTTELTSAPETLDGMTEIGEAEVEVANTPTVAESGYFLTAESATEVLGDAMNCEDYTMYVKFSEAFPTGTNLWFVIEGPDGVTYGIAGSEKQTQAWSFLNKDQFESWPEGVEPGAFTEGEYEVRIYETEDLVTTVIPDEADLDDPIATVTIGVVKNEYTITFDANGGEVDTETAVTVNGKLTTLPTPTRSSSYRFDGWYTEDGEEVTTDTVFYEDQTITADWTRRSSGGSSGSSSSSSDNQSEDNELPFTDVSTDDWFYDAVLYMYENDCMNGLTDTTFGPYATTTRGMIVTMLYRHENEPDVTTENPFTDVSDTQYYADAVNWAAANGIVTGYNDTTFGPDNTITREQMATILYRYAEYKGYDTTEGGMAVREFADYEEISDWSMTAVTWAVNAELLNGKTNNNLDPQGNATRAEVATILMRFCENFVK